MNVISHLQSFIDPHEKHSPFSVKDLNAVESFYAINLPDDFIDFSREHNGARFVDTYVDINSNQGERMQIDIEAFLRIENPSVSRKSRIVGKPERILDSYYCVDDVILFGESGGHYYFCFDYRSICERDKPEPSVSILFTNDIVDEDKNPKFKVLHVADDFCSFAKMFYKYLDPEEIEYRNTLGME